MRTKYRLNKEKVRELLTAMGQNQARLACHIGIAPSNMSSFMTGTPISVGMSNRIATALGTTRDVIVESFEVIGTNDPVAPMPFRDTTSASKFDGGLKEASSGFDRFGNELDEDGIPLYVMNPSIQRKV
jgi:transcriptional regulator with XRE-family HTH domain